MQALAALPDGGSPRRLAPLTDAYAAWIDDQEAGAAAPDVAPYRRRSTPQVLAAMRSNLARIRAGIDLLDADPQAAAAFRFANRAMAQQRVRTLYTERKRRGQPVELPRSTRRPTAAGIPSSLPSSCSTCPPSPTFTTLSAATPRRPPPTCSGFPPAAARPRPTWG
jgi:hypothetical protein